MRSHVAIAKSETAAEFAPSTRGGDARYAAKWALCTAAFLFSAEQADAEYFFGPPIALGPTVNCEFLDAWPDISADGLSLYFGSLRPTGLGGADIWVSARQTTEDAFGPAANLGPTINDSEWNFGAEVSFDGLTLYFNSNPLDGPDAADELFVSTRPSLLDDWEFPVNLGTTLNSSKMYDRQPAVTADGLELYYSRSPDNAAETEDLWVSTRATPFDAWGTPVRLDINSTAFDGNPSISSDRLSLFFDSERAGGLGARDIYVSTRATTTSPWQEPVNVGAPVNSPLNDGAPDISWDGSEFYFARSQTAGFEGVNIWQARILNAADFDEDGDVDGDDFLHWQDGFGTLSGATHSNGDADRDGDVDGDDFLVWQNQFGLSAAIAVPEPMACGLLLVITLGLSTRYLESRCRSFPRRGRDRSAFGL